MPWWVIDPGSPDARVQSLTAAEARDDVKLGDLVAGPYSSQASAQAALAAAGGTGSKGSGGGKGSGSPAPPPASAGSWYIEYIVGGGLGGGQAVPKVIEAASPP
jgi:hypothetical protein